MSKLLQFLAALVTTPIAWRYIQQRKKALSKKEHKR